MANHDLVTFYCLLREGYTVAQLATAVEKFGVHGTDAFGREAAPQRRPTSALSMAALEALSRFRQHEASTVERWDTTADPAGELFESPLDIAADFPNEGIHHFGWPADALPDFQAIGVQPQAPKAPTSEYRSEPLLHIIGGLLSFNRTRQNPSTQNQIIQFLLEHFPNATGISKSNLEKVFSDASKRLPPHPKKPP